MIKLIKVIVSIAIWIFIFGLVLAMCDKNDKLETANTTFENWVTTLMENGFSDEEIESYNEILLNVGITDYHNVEVIENGTMHIIHGQIFDSDKCSLHITLEDRKVIVVYATVPYDVTKAHSKWLCDIDLNSEKPNGTFDLYYDVDGGYTAKLDWVNKTIRPYRQ